MTNTGKQRKRENRKRKRQLIHALKEQAKTQINETPLSDCIEINKPFIDYALQETRREIRNGEIETERIELLLKVMELKKKGVA